MDWMIGIVIALVCLLLGAAIGALLTWNPEGEEVLHEAKTNSQNLFNELREAKSRLERLDNINEDLRADLIRKSNECDDLAEDLSAVKADREIKLANMELRLTKQAKRKTLRKAA